VCLHIRQLQGLMGQSEGAGYSLIRVMKVGSLKRSGILPERRLQDTCEVRLMG
jgi:hypothetical protein